MAQRHETVVPITTKMMGRLFLLSATATGGSGLALVFEAVLGLQQVQIRYMVATVISLGLSAWTTSWAHQRLLDMQYRADAARREESGQSTPTEWQVKPTGRGGGEAGSGQFGGPRREPPQ